jgi:hypothetical protein
MSETNEVVFTNNDAEQLYNSCADMQRITFSLQMEIQLAKLVSKLRQWTTPITESKQKYAKSLGFIINGNQFIQSSEWLPEQREQKLAQLSEEFEKTNKEKFEHWDELKAILPLPLFTTKKFEDGGYKFIEESKDRPAQNKQYFIEFCLNQE